MTVPSPPLPVLQQDDNDLEAFNSVILLLQFLALYVVVRDVNLYFIPFVLSKCEACVRGMTPNVKTQIEELEEDIQEAAVGALQEATSAAGAVLAEAASEAVKEIKEEVTGESVDLAKEFVAAARAMVKGDGTFNVD